MDQRVPLRDRGLTYGASFWSVDHHKGEDTNLTRQHMRTFFVVLSPQEFMIQRRVSLS